MQQNRFSRLNSRQNELLPYGALLITYFLCRLFFQQLTITKSAFIFPTGVLVEWFYSAGDYINREWIFGIGETQFVLGESCSGTTFFSLLIAYITFRIITNQSSYLWLLYAYPIAIVANTMRVLSSIYAHNALLTINAFELRSEIHVVTGAIAFLFSFLIVAYIIEKPNNRLQYER